MNILNDGASKELRKRLGEMECDIVRILSDDPDWLSYNDQASLRWALSLARITKINVAEPNKNQHIAIDHATDRYRAELFAILSTCLSPLGRINKEELGRALKNITQIAQRERLEILSLFQGKLNHEMLDEAARRRPLALSLSGGGGAAYVFVGAFQALEESKISPSVISGSSMGAVLGAYRARTQNFSFDAINALVAKTTWNKVAQPFSGHSRFGVPATFRLYFRDVVGHEFEKDDRFLWLKDLAIPLRVCVAGLSAAYPAEEDLQKYANLFDEKQSEINRLKARHSSVMNKILEFAQKPLKAIYLGGDALTEEFDVLDAVGFSSAIPGVFHYDILRNDPRMIELINNLFKREGVARLIDGGFVDNLPVLEAIKAINQGVAFGFDPFVVGLDCFSPSLNRNWLFYPLMRFAMENSKAGHALAHFSFKFKKVLSPIHFVPTKETFSYAVESGYSEIIPHINFIRKMVGPIPDPAWLKQ